MIDLAGDFRLPGIGVSGLVRVRAPVGRLARQGRVRAAGAVRRPDRRRAAGREPRLLPDAGDPRARAAALGRTRRRRARSSSTARPGCRARAARRARRPSFAATEESVRPYRFPGHQHTPEMERGSRARDGVHARRVVRAAPGARRPRRGDDGVRADSARRHDRGAHRRAWRTRTPTRPFVRVLPPARWSTRSGARLERRRAPGGRGPADRAPPSWSARSTTW